MATKEKGTKKSETVEEQILRVTEQQPQGKKEKRQTYLERLLDEGNSLEEKDYTKKFNADTREWIEGNIELYNDQKPLNDFPGVEDESDDEEEDDSDEEETEEDEEEETDDDESDDEEEEEKPAKKKAVAKKSSSKKDDEEEEETDDDDDEEEEETDDEEEEEEEEDEKPSKPKPKAKVKAKAKSDDEEEEEETDDEEEESDDEEETDDDEDEEDDKKSKSSTTKKVRELVCKYQDFTKDQIFKKVKKLGLKVTEGTVAVTYYDTHNVMDILKKQGKLVEPEEDDEE